MADDKPKFPPDDRTRPPGPDEWPYIYQIIDTTHNRVEAMWRTLEPIINFRKAWKLWLGIVSIAGAWNWEKISSAVVAAAEAVK